MLSSNPYPFFNIGRKEVAYKIESGVGLFGCIYNMYSLKAYGRAIHAICAELFACDRIKFRHCTHADFVDINNFHVTTYNIGIGTDDSLIRCHSDVSTVILNGNW